MTLQTESFFLSVSGTDLEVHRIDPVDPGALNNPPIVFLHEGLGSVSLWRDFPARVAAATDCPVIVYSRKGYGKSGVVRESRNVRYMHEEAIEVLPGFLQKLGIETPILLGHSDGASIALIYAGTYNQVQGLILLAPHVFVEPLTVASIAEAKERFNTSNLAEKLARHHKDSVSTFWGWNDIWLHPDFLNWNIEEYLPKINCPILAIQGKDDEYGTLRQLQAIERQVHGPFGQIVLDHCKHSPHRDQPDLALAAITQFVATLKSGA